MANQSFGNDDVIISGLEYLMNHKSGYMTDLEQHVDKNILTAFKILGFLRIGYTKNAETYSITSFGIQYYNIIKNPQKSLLARIFQRKR